MCCRQILGLVTMKVVAALSRNLPEFEATKTNPNPNTTLSNWTTLSLVFEVQADCPT